MPHIHILLIFKILQINKKKINNPRKYEQKTGADSSKRGNAVGQGAHKVANIYLESGKYKLKQKLCIILVWRILRWILFSDSGNIGNKHYHTVLVIFACL